MDRVGVRELRQNLSVYLRRVQSGEILEVTERGKPVARLQPLIENMSALDRRIAEGKARPATKDFSDLPPPLPARPGEKTLTEILLEMREEEEF